MPIGDRLGQLCSFCSSSNVSSGFIAAFMIILGSLYLISVEK